MIGIVLIGIPEYEKLTLKAFVLIGISEHGKLTLKAFVLLGILELWQININIVCPNTNYRV